VLDFLTNTIGVRRAVTEAELKAFLQRLYPRENEACEWKEFKNLSHSWNSRKADDVESYVSAIANMCGGHIVLGVKDGSLEIVGIREFGDYTIDNARYRLAGRCSHLNTEKLQIESFTTSDTSATIWVLHVPQHEPRLPVYAHGKPWQRVGDSLVPMRPERLDAILREPIDQVDWSAGIVDRASLSDLDEAALLKTRERFSGRNAAARWASEIAGWSNSTLLDRAKLTAGGKITRAAILLLGKRNSIHFLSPHPGQLTWSLETEERAYEHFFPPFILTTSELHEKIRNIKQKLFPENQLLPVEIQKYDSRTILEALHNCIAHQDYTRTERIVVTEKADRLIFENAGGFFEGLPDAYLTGNVRPRAYRNKWLADAMVEISMIDTMGYGIFEMTKSQMGRYLPLPDYTRSSDQRVVLEVLGRPIDEKYSQLLLQRGDLDIDTVILLDRVQKKLPITDEAVTRLRRDGLIEGRRPNIFVAASVAEATGTQATYARSKGMDKGHMKQFVLDYVARFSTATRTELDDLLVPMMPANLSDKQKQDRVKNLLSEMSSKDRTIVSEGRGPGAVWKERPPES
jgi:ATP-dependent DNA helicase RecG